MKLKIPEENNIPTDSAMGVGEETKADDSIQSTRSNIRKQFCNILAKFWIILFLKLFCLSYDRLDIDKEQIEIDEEMTKYAQQVHNDKITLSKKFTDPSGTLESSGDASMTSSSLCSRI